MLFWWLLVVALGNKSRKEAQSCLLDCLFPHVPGQSVSFADVLVRTYLHWPWHGSRWGTGRLAGSGTTDLGNWVKRRDRF